MVKQSVVVLKVVVVVKDSVGQSVVVVTVPTVVVMVLTVKDG